MCYAINKKNKVVLDKIVKVVISDSNNTEAIKCIGLFGELAAPSLKLLTELVESENNSVVIAALEAISRVGVRNLETKQVILNNLINKEKDVLIAAIECARYYENDDDICKNIIEMIGDNESEDRNIRIALLTSISINEKYKDELLEILINKMLIGDKREKMISIDKIGLIGIGSLKAIAALKAMLEKTDSKDERMIILNSLQMVDR